MLDSWAKLSLFSSGFELDVDDLRPPNPQKVKLLADEKIDVHSSKKLFDKPRFIVYIIHIIE